MKSPTRFIRCVMSAALLAALAEPAVAADPPRPATPPAAGEILAEIGLSEAERKKVLDGELVRSEVTPLSERDVTVGLTFLVKGAAPEALSKELSAGTILPTDPQVKKSGAFRGAGSLVDLSRLRLEQATAMELAGVKAGARYNFSTPEVAAFSAIANTNADGVSQQLHTMLVDRMHAYSASGLAGIAPYDRGDAATDVAADLRKASESVSKLAKYVPALGDLLVSYPKGVGVGTRETFHWLDYDLAGTRTFVLTHGMILPHREARAVVQRQYYVSTGYDAEQAVAVFLPVAEGTLVIYRNHTFAAPGAGVGGQGKKTIGSGLLVTKLEAMFEKQKAAVAN
jgi:hypothetical protein